jgi:hypothetical protein
MRLTVGSGASSGRGPLAKLLPSLFFLVFLGVGLYFTAIVAGALWGGLAVWSWERAECTVLASEFRSDAEAVAAERFVAAVRYRYAWQGAEHEGALQRAFSDAGDAQALRDRYPPGQPVPCFVDPDSPADSRLRRPSPWGVLVILFPLLFVGAGAVPLYLLWRSPRPEAAAASAQALTAAPKAPRWVGCVLPAFFSVFFFAGLAVLWWLMLSPLLWISRARAWEPTPCTVVSSGLAQQSDSDGTTYRIEIVYRYLAAGREYQSSRYDFQTAFSGDAAGKQAIVDRYAAGQPCTCFVDPAEPSRAVLSRGFRKSYWAGLLGLPFLLVGLGGLLWSAGAFRGRARAAAPARGGFSGWREGGLAGGPGLLRPKSGPWKKLAGALFVNLFWNGIVAVFVVVIAKDWRAGSHDWMPILILTPFALIGLALLAGLPHSLLALANPRPWIELERAALTPGQAAGARYRFSGLVRRIERLTIAIEGREAVTTTTRSGGKSSTSSRDTLFHREVLWESPPGGTPREGAFTLAVPADTMHSFTASSNAVRWRLKVHGDVPRWPDLDEEFEIAVLPPELGA